MSAPSAQVAQHRAEIEAAVRSVLDSGRFILGPQVATFETEFAAYCGTQSAVGVGSGTDALHLALRALGIGAGDEVITVSHTAVATVAAIEMSGARPVLIDIDANSYTLDPARLRGALSSRTKVIVPVHLYGQPAEMMAIVRFARDHGLKVIEDCAQAHGAVVDGRRVGSIGDAGCFSFYPTKNLGAIGDGGMVVCQDGAVADRLRRLREYGWRDRISTEAGFNSRLDELQAAILRVKLPSLDADNGRRRAVAAVYDAALAASNVVIPAPRSGSEHVYHLYVVRCRDRKRIRAELSARGIETAIHYPVPVHRQPAYAGRVGLPGGMAVTEAAVAEIVSLPMYPEITIQQVKAAAQAMIEVAAPVS